MIHEPTAYCHSKSGQPLPIESAMNTPKPLAVFAALAWLNYAAVSAAIVAVAGLTIWPARAEMDVETARPSVTLELGSGSSFMLGRPFRTILIGNPDVIDVQKQNELSVLLKPLNPGATNLVFIDEQGIVITNLAILVRSARAI
jgi:Flp pilus assembly secretin CpaC